MIFGSYLYDIKSLSLALTRLGYTHFLVGSELSQIKKVVLPYCLNYPIYLVDGLHRVNHLMTTQCSVVIVCDAKSALLNSSVDCKTLFAHYTEEDLLRILEKIVSRKEVQSLEIREPTLEEIVDKVTTKSILTDIQTFVNKVNPYDLRKKVHKYIISYLYGEISYSKLMKFFNTSTKLDTLKQVLSEPEAKKIRCAVADYLKEKDEQAVAQRYGIHTFEILYVYNSYSNLKG